MTFDTLRWVSGRLEMLDQRLLPARVEYRGFDSAAEVAGRDPDHGRAGRAGPSVCAAAYGAALAAQQLQGAARTEFMAGMNAALLRSWRPAGPLPSISSGACSGCGTSGSPAWNKVPG